MGFDCVITKRENAIEKKDFMVISNYFQYPGTVFINLLYTHTHTHTRARYLRWLYYVKEETKSVRNDVLDT